MPEERSIRRAALLGNQLPRQSGIATFPADLCEILQWLDRHDSK